MNAAIEMIHALEAYSRERSLSAPLKVHIGINTGLAISGDVSGPVLREFALMGDAVNVAARLKDLAPPGHVYVGAETHRSTRHEFEYRSLPPLKLKGKDLEVRAYELLSTRERLHRARAAGLRPSPLVGRDELVSSLEARLAEVAVGIGNGGITSLVAEAGVGKSRLLAELASRAGAQGIVWLEGRSVSVGRTLAFHPFADLLRSWAGITDDDSDTEARDKLERAIAERLPEAAAEEEPALASLMGLKLRGEDRKRLRGVEGEAMENVTLRAAENPFYLEEVVRSLVDDGAVREDADGLHATERLRDVVIPGSIQEVLMARLDRLPVATRQVLQVAAVTGRSLHRVVIAAVTPPEADLDAHLSELESAGMLSRRDPHGRLWAFRHPLIQDVAYDSILRARREELHRAVAHAIEAHLSDSLPGYHGMVRLCQREMVAPDERGEAALVAEDDARRVRPASERGSPRRLDGEARARLIETRRERREDASGAHGAATQVRVGLGGLAHQEWCLPVSA